MTHSGKPIIVAILLATSLAGCQGHSTRSQSAAKAPSVTPTKISSSVLSAPSKAHAAQLMADAESFENLTESAFTTGTKKMDGLIANAKASGADAARLLAPAQAKQLSNHLAAIDAGRVSNNRADLAIAAVEGYRTLVSNAGDHLAIPKEVSLLDYSGFRFQADLKASPVRWNDTVKADDFADSQWKKLSPAVSDQPLRAKFTSALVGMRAASQRKDAKAAMSASTRELDLVDALEQFFAHA